MPRYSLRLVVYANTHSLLSCLRCLKEVERFEALEQAASDDLGANRRLTRSAMRQRVL